MSKNSSEIWGTNLIEERNYPLPYGLSTLFEAGMDRELPNYVIHDDANGEANLINLGAGYKFLDYTDPLGAEQGWWAGTPLPYDDESVAGIWSFHFFEHLGKDELMDVLRECERVLMVDAVLNIVVPHYISEGAFHDLDHKTFFTESTWRNLMENTYYDGTMDRDWKFRIGLNLIMGLNVRNLALVTQLIKTNG